MIHPNLIRLKNYEHDPSKFAYKAEHAVERILDDELLLNPTIILVYSTGCWHCLDFMKDKIENGRRQKSLWRRFRHRLLREGFTVLQINVNALPHFQREAEKLRGDDGLIGVLDATRAIYGVPSLIGMSAEGKAQEFEGSRSFESLVRFMKSFT